MASASLTSCCACTFPWNHNSKQRERLLVVKASSRLSGRPPGRELGATARFQEINEAYQVLSDPDRRREYDEKGRLYFYDYNVIDYLNQYKGLILTCNGLGIKHSIW